MAQKSLFPKNQFLIPRGIIKRCETCNKEFGIFLREHLCKRCQKTVCSDCGNQQKEVYKLGYTKRPHRLCKLCKERSDFLGGYIKMKNLRFGSMSVIATSWMTKLLKPKRKTVLSSKQSKLKLDHIRELWDSYSFEFREYAGLLTF